MRIAIISSLMLFYCATHSQTRKITAETSIKQVTIFTSGARVERTATVNIQLGRSEISFAGLSNQLDQQTVQLKAEANITLLSVQTTKDFLTERKIQDQEKDFIDRINAISDKLDLDQKLYEVYKNEEAMLIKNQAIAGQAGVKTIDLKEALEFQRQRLTEVYGKELEIQKRMMILRQDLDRSKAQLGEFSKKKDSVNYIVTALIDSKETRSVNFQLLYNVKEAGWYPTYDVRVIEITKPLSILMNANIFQQSGESWKNIPLELSSGNPNDNATPTELQPWMLGFYDPSISLRAAGPKGIISGRITSQSGEPVAGAIVSVEFSRFASQTDKNGYFRLNNVATNSTLLISSVGFQPKRIIANNGYMTIALEMLSSSLNEVVVTGYTTENMPAGVAIEKGYKKKDVSIQPVTIATQYQPTATVYRIDDKYTLESDGKTTTIGIKQFEVPAIYDYYSAPKIDPAVFLTARITNWEVFDLQSGEVSLYFEGTYLGKTYVDLGVATDTLSLSLGKDNAIKASRKLIREYSTRKLIGSNRTDSKQFEITIRNSKKVPVSVKVFDQLPVSITKEISIEDARAAEAQIDRETGIVTWLANLPPVQEKKLAISYSVKYPKDRKLILE